jgi:hypothetical protein
MNNWVPAKSYTQGVKKYIINQDLWSLLNNTNKAGLILHEIVYSDAIMRGQNNSIYARYFNALLSSKEITKLSQKEYKKIMRKTRLKQYNSKAFDTDRGISRYGLFRYFSGFELSYDDAVEYCGNYTNTQLFGFHKGLGGYPSHTFKPNPIVSKIFRKYGEDNVLVWGIKVIDTIDGDEGEEDKEIEKYYAYRMGSPSVREETTADAKHQFICRTTK